MTRLKMKTDSAEGFLAEVMINCLQNADKTNNEIFLYLQLK